MEFLKREAPDEEKLTTLLDFYELRALKERVKKTNLAPSLFDETPEVATTPSSGNKKKETDNTPIQGSLFDFFPTDYQDGATKRNESTLLLCN